MTTSQEWFETDFYAVLGVSPDASQKEITKAYRVLAKQYHPDANSTDQSAAEKFKEVTQSYEVIGDEEKRKEYDSIRMMMQQNVGGPGGQGFGYPPGFQGAYSEQSAGQAEDLSDLLSGLFSRMRKPSAGGPGAQQGVPRNPGTPKSPGQTSAYDIETNTTVSFYQALEGTTVAIAYSLPNQPTPKEVKVKVPAGVNSGQRIKVSGRGVMSPRGKSGDLYVTIDVTEHPWFGRKGRTLMVNVPISYPESIVGTNVKVPTLTDPVTLKVPPKTKSGTKMRVKGRGCDIGGEKGDLLVTFEIVPPAELSEKETQLLKELVANQQSNPRAKFGLEK